jgi:hypothetical protein
MKTVQECTKLCEANKSCKSFEYGNGKPGKNKGSFKKYDCHLQSSAANINKQCGRQGYGLDLYIKTEYTMIKDKCVSGQNISPMY